MPRSQQAWCCRDVPAPAPLAALPCSPGGGRWGCVLLSAAEGVCALFNGCFCPSLIPWRKPKCPCQACSCSLGASVSMNSPSSSNPAQALGLGKECWKGFLARLPWCCRGASTHPCGSLFGRIRCPLHAGGCAGCPPEPWLSLHRLCQLSPLWTRRAPMGSRTRKLCRGNSHC